MTPSFWLRVRCNRSGGRCEYGGENDVLPTLHGDLRLSLDTSPAPVSLGGRLKPWCAFHSAGSSIEVSVQIRLLRNCRGCAVAVGCVYEAFVLVGRFHL